MAERVNNYRVVIADGNSSVAASLTPVFEAEHFFVATALTMTETLMLLRSAKPDIIVIHSMTPGIDGVALCREIRKESYVPIIMISEKLEELDCMIALEIGVDDYVRKPIGERETVARCKAILRRMNEWKQEKTSTYIKIDNLEIDMNAYQIRLDGAVVSCTPKEIEIVWMLASNPDIVFSREHMLQNIWGYDYLGDARAVDSHIKRIRAKLCKPENHWDIRTVWGVGYRFEEDNP